MYSNRPPPPYTEQLTVAVLGKKIQLRNIIGNSVLGNGNAFTTTSENLVVAEDSSFKILNTPDFFDEESVHPDQQIIDFMALSYPGPHLFILAIDSENVQKEKVMAQVRKLQETFGNEVTAHLVVMLPNRESFNSLSHLKDLFGIWLQMNDESLGLDCRKACCGHPGFRFDYKNYSHDVVMRRRMALDTRRFYCHPPSDPGRAGSCADGAPDNKFNIILLGLTGTGKSATANTILTAGNADLDPRQLFRSQSSSMPVTTQCEVRTMERLFGMQVRVVDTPDFFHDHLKNSESQVEECKKYCQHGRCVVLLVLQLGRFTDDEHGILERLENKLGWRIRESTIVLLTHGEDLRGTLEQFINTSIPLKNIVVSCGCRYHLFNNTSKDTKQVMELFKKIPDFKIMFPNFSKKKKTECCLC